jgi:uncharacterized protein YegJ (DUF2314 family)
MSEPVFMFDSQDPAMQLACAAARGSFKYFWRELSWEKRRIVPGLDMSMVKLPFTDGPRTDGNSEYEYMWVGQVDFDGDWLSGELLNAPNWLTSVQQGEEVQVPFAHLNDWMMTSDGKAYGGFTVNAMRAKMNRRERKDHDDAWGLDFGDPASVLVELHPVDGPEGLTQPENFREHPMCVNMLPQYDAQLHGDPTIAQQVDEAGWTLLHRDALAGNLGVVKVLVACGAEVGRRTPSGRTASELARSIGWPEIADYLDGQAAR